MKEFLVHVETETHEWDQLLRVRARNKTAAVLAAGAVLGINVRPDWVIGVTVTWMK